MYTVTRIDSNEAFEALRADWDRLFARTEHHNVFGTFDWLHTWWQTFGNEHGLYLLVIRQDKDIVGIAPLMITLSTFLGRPKKTIRFIGTPEIDYGDFLGADKTEIAQQVVGYLVDNGSDWTDIDLSQISERSSTVDPLRKALKAARIRYRLIRIETCSSFVFEGSETDRANFDPRRDKGLKSDINYFKRTGQLELIELTEPEEITRELYGLFHCHTNRWQQTSTPSFFLQNRYCDFYQTLTDRLAPGGGISMLILKHDGLVLAYQFNFALDGTTYLYTLTHNVFHRRRAPGMIINYFARKNYVRGGYAELDFVRGAQGHKSRMTNHSYQNYQIRVYSSLIPRTLTRWYDQAKATDLFQGIVKSRRLKDLRDRVVLHYRQQGIGGLIKKALSKIASAVIDTKVVYIFRYEGTPDISVDARLPVEIRKLGPKDTDEIASFLGLQAGSSRYQTLVERFEKDADCFASLYNGRIACIGWGLYHEDRNPVTGFSALPTRKQVLFSDGFTSPVLRGRRLRPHLMVHQLNHYQRKGLKCITAIYRRNTPSIRVVEGLHFKKVKSVRQLRVLGVNVLHPRAVTVPDGDI
jgi:CelD/BcsL family acetyltransferase involved in cellulose biosynthesis